MSGKSDLTLLATGGVDPRDICDGVKDLQKLVADTLFFRYQVKTLPRSFRPEQCVSPRHIRFPLDLVSGERLKRVTDHRNEIAILAGKQSCEIFTDEEGVLWIEFPRSTSVTVNALDYLSVIQPPGEGHAALGVDSFGNPVSINMLASDVVHVLTTGTSGSGKTINQRVMLASMALWTRPRTVNFLILDVKGGESFGVFGDAQSSLHLLHLAHPVIYEPPEMKRVLWWVVSEIERRQEARVRLPHLFVVTDELAEVLTVAGQDAHDAFKRILERGRSAGVHVMAATTRPGKESIGVLGGMFKFRITLSAVRATDAFMATNRAGSGASGLSMGGDMLIGDRSVRAQGFMISDSDIQILLNRWMKPEARRIDFQRSRGALPVPPVPKVGRPVAEPTDKEVDEVLFYYSKNGKLPSVSALTRGILGKGMGSERARKLLAEARVKIETGAIGEEAA